MKQKLLACMAAAAVLSVAVAAFCAAFPASAELAPTQLTTANGHLLPAAGDNRLATAQLLNAAGAGAHLERALDGVIPGVNSDAADGELKAEFPTGGTAARSDGTPWNGAAGWCTLSFRLAGRSELRQFLVAGSANDSTNFSYAGTQINNKHIVYYEIYAADTQEALFSADSLVTACDNSQTLGICQLFTLEQPLSARYVGFKLVGGAYSLARVGELGAYGSLAVDDYTPLTDAASMTAAVGAQDNLLAGAAVQDKPYDGRLVLEGLTDYTGEAALLTDGQVSWTAAEDVVTYTRSDSNRPVYDLRGTAALTGVLLVGGCAESGAGLQYFRVYAADSRDALFSDIHLAAFAVLNGQAQGGYVSISGVSGRYVGFDAVSLDGDAVTVAELGVYGSYTGSVEHYVHSLIRGKTPVQMLQISARGIDNKTALSADGAAGSGNTGNFTGAASLRNVTNLACLTDGLNDRRTVFAVHGSKVDELAYDTPWIVLTYDLGGLCRVTQLRLDSFARNGDLSYSVGGVQFYASANHADLFKNESLLYTSGGEKYTTDAAGSYIPDHSTGLPVQETLTYGLTAAQQATQVRYVSLVITRPYNYLYASGSRIVGYNQSRLAEFIVEGTMVTADAPLQKEFTVASSKGEVKISIQQKTLDDRDFFSDLQGWRLTEETLAAEVSPRETTGWLTADGSTVFHLELLNKSGQVVSDLGGRTVTVALPTAAEYTQSAGQLRDGEIVRFYNAYDHADGYIYIGSENYPTYEEGTINNRDKAFIQSGDVRLVYLKYRDILEIRAEEDAGYHESLLEFQNKSYAAAKGGAAQ